MKLCPAAAQLLHEDGRKDTDMTKLIVAFRTFANVSNKLVPISNTA